MFENVDIQHTHPHTHIRTTEAYLYYKLTNEPKGELKKTKMKMHVFICNFKKYKGCPSKLCILMITQDCDIGIVRNLYDIYMCISQMFSQFEGFCIYNAKVIYI